MLNRSLRHSRCITNLVVSTLSHQNSPVIFEARPILQQVRNLNRLVSASADHEREVQRWAFAWDKLLDTEKRKHGKHEDIKLLRAQDASESHPPVEDEHSLHKKLCPEFGSLADLKEQAQLPQPMSSAEDGLLHSNKGEDVTSPQSASLVGSSKDTRSEQKRHTKTISLLPGYHGADVIERELKGKSGHLESLSRKWTTNFAKINSAYSFKSRLPHDIAPDLPPWYSSSEEISLIDTKFQDQRVIEGRILQDWSSPSRTQDWWQPTLLWALHTRPFLALSLLDHSLTGIGPRIPSLMVNDCLDHIACALFLSQRKGEESLNRVQPLLDTACNFLNIYGPFYDIVSLSQRTIFLLAVHANKDQLERLHTCLKATRAGLHTNTKLQMMKSYVSFGKIEKALDLLQTIPKLELSLDKIQSFCVGLLRAHIGIENLYSVRSSILAHILELGIRPNRQMTNVIMLNAIEAGDLSTAWKAHEIARDNGLAPDQYTYTVLLKGVRYGSIKDNIRSIYESAKREGLLAQHPRLGFELLHAIYLAESTLHDSNTYATLLPVYRELFDTSSLRALGLPIGDGDAGRDDPPLTTPPLPALGLMLHAWLQQCHDIDVVPQVYERYMNGVRSRHAEISELATTTHTNNSFIIALGRSRQTLHFCTTVVQNMLKPSGSVSAALPENSASNNGQIPSELALESNTATFAVAPPDVQTWSILLFAFVRNGQLNAAEKVLTMMKHRGHSPNQVTWNSLLNHYSRMQDVKGVVGTVERMEMDGFDTNDRTIKALGQVVDRKRLIEAFEKATSRTEAIGTSER